VGAFPLGVGALHLPQLNYKINKNNFEGENNKWRMN